MKKNLKISLFFCLATLLFDQAFAQEDLSLAQRQPNQIEKVIVQDAVTTRGYNTMLSAYNAILKEAKIKHAGKSIDIRNLKKGKADFNTQGDVVYYYTYTIIELPDAVALALNSALTKSLSDIDKNKKFAFDKLYTPNYDKNKIKNQVIDHLKKGGHKIVAKDYLYKLKKEQEGPDGGLHNPETIVKSNNFSAVGYFININITEEYLQIEIINVSTGEVDGNAIEDF